MTFNPASERIDLNDIEIEAKHLTLTGNQAVGGTLAVTGALTASAGIQQASGFVMGIVPDVVQQAINANGAISVATYDTALTSVTTTGVTYTMADGTKLGQLKRIHMVADGGSDATVTFNTNATLVFADVGDYAVLVWNGSDWIPISLGNEATGDVGPAYTPAS